MKSLGLADPGQVALMLKALMQDDTAGLIEDLNCGVSPKLRFLVEGSIGTMLHWGIHCNQLDSVKALLANISDNSFLKLLTIRDSQGKTPSLLAKEKSQQRDTKATEILKYLQGKQRAIEANQGSHTQSRPADHTMVVLPIDYEQHIVMLKTKLFDGIDEDDYPYLRPALPILCALAYYTCRQALQQFAHQPFLENQALLLKRLSGNALEQLRQTIEITADYLGDVLQKDRVNQVIELCIRFPNDQSPGNGYDGIAFCDMQNEKIYMNITKFLRGSDIPTVVHVVIHEISHLAAKTYDFARTEPLLAELCGTQFHLNQCIQLVEQAECNPAFPIWKIKVGEIARLLAPVGDQKPRIPLGQYLATQNADTVAMTAIGLSAIAAGFGAFVDKFFPPIDSDGGQGLREEWFVLEINRGFFSSNRIKSVLEESDILSCRPQTPPPNGAGFRDSDGEKLPHLNRRVRRSPPSPSGAVNVTKFIDTIAGSGTLSSSGSHALELLNSDLNTKNQPHCLKNVHQMAYSHHND